MPGLPAPKWQRVTRQGWPIGSPRVGPAIEAVLRIGVIGHVEYITLGSVAAVPSAGDIAHLREPRVLAGGGPASSSPPRAAATPSPPPASCSMRSSAAAPIPAS